MAATKPQLSSLKTPLSASFPSQNLRSPCVGTPTFIKQEDQKTPITPPAAYLDFLKQMSPNVMTPISAGVNSRFNFEKPVLSSCASVESITTTASSTSFTSTAPAETSRPSSPKSNSSRSSSCSSCSHESVRRKRPESISLSKGAILPSQSPFAIPHSARTPRRLHIPQSPYSPAATVRSPLSASSVYSPYSAALSPRDPWDPEKARSTAMSVRQVVTRTVTHYSRTPIVEPVPPSKKRKVDASEDSS